MVQRARIDGDLVVLGELLGCTSIAYPAGSVENVDISGSAAIAASKCQKSLRAVVHQVGNAATETHLMFIVKGAALTFKKFTVSNITACAGSTTVTVDVKKNATTILSAVITLDSSKTPYSETEAVISVGSAADGDYVTIVITATQSGTDALATGVMAQLDYDEDYAP